MTNSTLKGLLAECRVHEGTHPSESLVAESRQLLVLAREDPSVLGVAAGELQSLPPLGAAWLAVVLGQAAEGYGGAPSSCQGILDLFFAWLEKAAALQRKSQPGPHEDEPGLDAALPTLCTSVVSHLARMPSQREQLSQDETLIEKLEDLASTNVGFAWVLEALQRTSGDLVVIHVESGRGFELRYENVANCFHLFSLVQAEIGARLPGGRIPDADVVAEAKGAGQKPVRDAAWWHYGDPRSPKPDLMASIWGEASVRSIPLVKGKQVMLLWTPLLQGRGWDSGFFAPHLQALPASVSTGHELSVEEARTWLDAVGIHAGSSSAKTVWWRRLIPKWGRG